MVELKRILLFLIGCIGLRLWLVYLAKNINPEYLKIMGYLALIPAIGFLVIYLGGYRKTGIEVSGGKIWWNHLRPIHGLLYFVFAFMAINKNNNAWKVLLLDVLIGLLFYIKHNFIV